MILVIVIKTLIQLYTWITLPIYFLLQQPWKNRYGNDRKRIRTYRKSSTIEMTDIYVRDDNGDYDLLRVQKEKLLEIEATIERRYLKPPLGFKNNQAVQFQTNDNSNGDCDYNEFANDDNATAGLIRWRDAAREAKCCSQIAMGLHFLENCIAWDKSIMRAVSVIFFNLFFPF